MGWGGVSGSRGNIVKAVRDKYNADGTLKSIDTKDLIGKATVEPTVEPVAVAPPTSPTPSTAPETAAPEETTAQVLERISHPDYAGPPPLESGEMKGTMESATVDPVLGGQATWTDASGKEIYVDIDPGMSRQEQRAMQRAIANTPSWMMEGATSKSSAIGQPKLQFRKEIKSFNKMPGQTVGNEGWKAAGQFNYGENSAAVSEGLQSNYEKVLKHELGHGIQHINAKTFGAKAIRKAYRQDRAHIVKNKKGDTQWAYHHYAYYRANDREAFAESIAQATVGSQYESKKKSEFRRANPHMTALVDKGLHKLKAKYTKKRKS